MISFQPKNVIVSILNNFLAANIQSNCNVKYTKSTCGPNVGGGVNTSMKLPSGHSTQVYFSFIKQIYNLCPSNVVKR